MASNVGTVNVNLTYGRCKDCKWWTGPGKIGQFNPHGNAECTNPKVANGGSLIDGIEDSYGDGAMLTGPDFGCIHFEEK